MKRTTKLCCILLILACIITCIPSTCHAKASNPFAGQTQERPLVSNGVRKGTYLRILASELDCTDAALKQLYNYYTSNKSKFSYVVLDFSIGTGLICNKSNKTFVYGNIKPNTKTNGIKMTKKKGTIKIKGKSVIRKTGNKLLDK